MIAVGLFTLLISLVKRDNNHILPTKNVIFTTFYGSLKGYDTLCSVYENNDNSRGLGEGCCA